MDDITLWSQLKSGDPKALKEIYDRHVRDLENYAKKFTKDIELIEDAIHDLFVQIWQKRDTLGHTDSIIKYLCVSLRRDIIRRVEKEMKTTSYTNVENDGTDFTISIEDILIQEESSQANVKKLHGAFEQLSSRQREAIFLKYYEEMSYEQICEIMDINYQSVRNLISKGILVLREHILILWVLFFVLF